MKIIEFDYKNATKCPDDLALCLGFFDAIHLGHQAIIKAAKETNLKVGVLTFDEPPMYVLKKRTSQLAITSTADKAEFFEDLGVDYLYILHFDMEVAELSRYEFIDYVLKKIDPKILFCGEDYSFGKDGEGNPTYLSNYFKVKALDFVMDNGEKISSRKITQLIKEGNVKEVSRLINRPYRLCGMVRHGNGNGKKLGFPTANIDLDYPYITPKEGVYMGFGIYNNVRYKAIITFGTHPTIIPLAKPIIEIHFIDFDKTIYGEYIFIEFVDYMRENMRFINTDELIKQLKKDEQKAKKVLKLSENE